MQQSGEEARALPMSELQRQVLEWEQVQRTHRRSPALHIPRSCKQLAQQVLVRELRAAADTLNPDHEDLAQAHIGWNLPVSEGLLCASAI